MTRHPPNSPQTARVRGNAFERRVRDTLERLDWYVLKSGASRTPVDLLAVSPWRVRWCIQAKGRTGTLGPGDRDAFFAWAERWLAIPILAQPQIGGGIRWRAWSGTRWIETSPQTASDVERPW